jgi:cytochrome b561
MELAPYSASEELLWIALHWGAEIYYWILFVSGFAFCLWASRKTKSKGYILVAVFFLQPVCSIGLRALSHHLHRDDYRQLEQNRDAALGERASGGKPVVWGHSYTIPLFETILLLGLLMTAKAQIKGEVTTGNDGKASLSSAESAARRP